MQGYTFLQNNEGIPHDKRGIFGSICQWVTRVSLSDGAALQHILYGVYRHCMQVAFGKAYGRAQQGYKVAGHT